MDRNYVESNLKNTYMIVIFSKVLAERDSG